MTAIHFTVPVAAEPETVQRRLSQAARDPQQFVGMFTTSDEIRADVAPVRDRLWKIRVEGPQFKSSGTTAVLSAAQGDGADIEIQIDVRGKGFLSIATPIIALAAGRIEDEATTALQREFGAR